MSRAVVWSKNNGCIYCRKAKDYIRTEKEVSVRREKCRGSGDWTPETIQ